MAAKESWATKFKKWERDQKETFAKALMSPPEPTTILKAIPYPGVIILMGSRGSGKTGLAHEIMSQFHSKKKLQGCLLLTGVLTRSQKKFLPAWVSTVSAVSQLPRKAVVLIDEAAQLAHARRSQSAMAVNLDNLISISRHRMQLIIFIAHHSRKLDINLIHDSDRLLWKQPTEAHVMFERDELQMFTRKAMEFFSQIKGEKQRKRATYVMDLHHLRFGQMTNKLPSYWREEISNGFQAFK